MDLLRRDLDSRWATLLQEKVEIVSGGKQDLRRMGQTLQAMVEAYADLARRGVVGEGAARPGAGLDQPHEPGHAHDVYVYDAGLHVLASNRHDLIDADLSGLKDIKGHAFAAAMLARDRATSMDYTLFRWPDGGYRAAKPAMPTSRSFPLAMDAGGRRRHARRAAARRWPRTDGAGLEGDTVPADAGAIRLRHDPGRPGPGHRAGPRASPAYSPAPTSTPAARWPLLRRQDDAKPLGRVPYANEHGAWLIETSCRPLKWTLVGAVPEQDLKSPAQRLMQRQAVAFAATLVLALTLAWLLAARLARPLNQLARYALQLAGRISPVPSPSARDRRCRVAKRETGRLAASFLHMADRLSGRPPAAVETAARERFERAERRPRHTAGPAALRCPTPRAGAWTCTP